MPTIVGNPGDHPPKLVIVRGPSGAGKSTRALEIVQASRRNCSMVAADDYFVCGDGEYRFKMTALKEAHAWCLTTTERRLLVGQDVVVHNTFTESWEARPYFELAERLGAEVEIVDLFDPEMSAATLAARCVHGLSEAQVQRQIDRYERPLSR